MKEIKNMQVTILKQLTATDTIIPNDSYRPLEYKLATVWYRTNHVQTYPINDLGKKDLEIIKQTV